MLLQTNLPIWTSVKIKISMTSVYKEYEIKTKMIHES